MKLPTFNGWLSWAFNGVPYTLRSSKNCKYTYISNPRESTKLLTYKEALYYNAEMAREYYADQFSLLYSGGIDSEIPLRLFKDLGIKHKTYIFKYEDDYNLRDYEMATKVASDLGVDYSVVDFNLKKFFENDAWSLFTKSKCIRAGRLVHLKLCELVDGIPVMGEAEPYWLRQLRHDYTCKSTWHFPLNESNHNCSMYLHSIGRENLCDFYEFTPTLIKAYQNHPIVKKLINDELQGKISSWTSRIPMHQEIWPDIAPRHKLTGYESSNPTGVYPEFINEFQKLMEAEVGSGDEYWLNEREVLQVFY